MCKVGAARTLACDQHTQTGLWPTQSNQLSLGVGADEREVTLPLRQVAHILDGGPHARQSAQLCARMQGRPMSQHTQCRVAHILDRRPHVPGRPRSSAGRVHDWICCKPASAVAAAHKHRSRGRRRSAHACNHGLHRRLVALPGCIAHLLMLPGPAQAAARAAGSGGAAGLGRPSAGPCSARQVAADACGGRVVLGVHQVAACSSHNHNAALPLPCLQTVCLFHWPCATGAAPDGLTWYRATSSE